MPSRTVECAFWRPGADGELVVMEIDVPTGLQPASVLLRAECETRAKRQGLKRWAQPATLEEGAIWLMFSIEGKAGLAELVKDFPNRIAAEMWLVHHG